MYKVHIFREGHKILRNLQFTCALCKGKISQNFVAFSEYMNFNNDFTRCFQNILQTRASKITCISREIFKVQRTSLTTFHLTLTKKRNKICAYEKPFYQLQNITQHNQKDILFVQKHRNLQCRYTNTFQIKPNYLKKQHFTNFVITFIYRQ